YSHSLCFPQGFAPCHVYLFTCQLHEYHYVDKNMNWTEAQQHCRKEYTDLATVSTMADMEQLRNIHSEKTEIWIGLFNLTGTNVTSHWSLPGLLFNESQAKWKRGEPDGVTSETCGAIEKMTETQWVDMSCMGSNSSAIKYYLGDTMTWFDALRYCRENHTELISGPQLNELHNNPKEKIIQVYNGNSENNLSSLSHFHHIFIGLFRDAWTWSDGSSFSFRHWNLNRTWEEALYYCRHHHHDLVTITNPEDQIWVQEKTKNASSPFVWTGLRYTCSLGFWFWVSDEVVHYKNWASPEQVNECDMSGAVQTGGEHKWFKKHDEEKFNFFCSK
uniref:C-type lectin domain-containing protein n=1 Tax=Oryzias latipes TaxID=8090 RepID=A0A3P9L7R8_ORYLA